MRQLSGILLLVLWHFFCSHSPKQESPNFIFILVDDLGWADIRCNYPDCFYDTPNIDRMATEGLRFTEAYAANPVCSPTRAALLTGKHPNRVNITDWIPGADPKNRPLLGPEDRNELELSELTLAEKLKKYGYKTCFVGKWHLGDSGFFPENQGFDINIGGHHRGSPPGGYYSPYKNPKLKDGPDGEYLPDRLTNESIHFIKENRDQPFFLYLAYYTVHTPIQASRRHIPKYINKREHMGISDVPHQKEGDGWTKGIQENAAFASMVEAMDENIGRILHTLEKEGLKDNTWIIFTSDNGGLSTLFSKNAPTNNGPLRAGKGWCYEGGIRIPLVIQGPHVKNPGRVIHQPVISMDHFPTIMDLAGLHHKAVDGRSLLPILKEEGRINREELFWHYPHYHGSAWKPGSAIRKGKWKLVLHYENQKIELFNLDKDPGERSDLSQKYPEKTNELKLRLDWHLQETGALLPTPNPAYKGDN